MKTLDFFVKRTSKVAVYDKFCAVDLELPQKGVLVASSARNCDFEKGALRTGFGAKRYYVETDLEKQIAAGSTVYGQPKMVFTTLMRTSDGVVKRTLGAQAGVNRIFVYELDGQVMKHIVMPKELLKVLSYVYPDGLAKMIFCCADQLYFYDFVNKSTKVFTDTLTGACLFHERLFVTNKNTMKYSVPMDVGNFEQSLNGGGEITFNDERGNIVWIESFDECIYLFFQYGIVKITADGEGSEFAISDIPYEGGHIIPRTICRYEDKLVFASYEGLFVLDGKKCTKLKQFRFSPIKNSTLSAYAGCLGNRYFLHYVDESNNKRSVFVDLEDERNGCECFIIYGLNNSGGKTLCASDYVYSYLDKDGDLPKGESYFFKVERHDFGSNKEKSLKYLSLEGVGTCTVTVQGRSKARTLSFDLGQRGNENGVNVNGADMVGAKRKLVGLKGREFGISITLQKGCVIRKMSFEYDELGGGK